MNNVMVDLETLGNGSNSVIISIGAVEFDPIEGLGREFSLYIDPQSCVDSGLEMDVSTVLWWMQQSDEARKVFNSAGYALSHVLVEFSDWYPKGAALWGNGATFDNVILSNAYRKTGLKQPWSFWNDRCYRTLKNLMPDVKLERVGTHHNALDDSKSQALHAIKLLSIIA